MINVGSAVGYLLLDTTGFKQGFQSALKDLNTFQNKSSTVADKFAAVGSAMTKTGGILTKNLTVPLVGAGTAFLKTASDFESAMATVRAISGATGDDFDALTEKAKEMGATTKFSASQSAEAFKYMAMAGWETEDMLNSIEGVMALAAASGEDLGTVSDIVTDAMTAFGLAADETSTVLRDGLEVEVANATRFVDVLAAASNSSNTNVSMLGESFKYVAATAGSLGYSIEDTAIALGLMANAGIKSSQAGTSLRQLFVNLAKPTSDVTEAMQDLGISLEDEEGKMKSLMELMQDLRNAFNGTALTSEEFQASFDMLNASFESGSLSEEEYLEQLEALMGGFEGLEGAQMASYAATLAGSRGMAGLLSIVRATDEDFERLTDSIYEANGTASEMESIQLDTFSGAVAILKSAVEGLAISFGTILLPAVRDFAEFLAGIAEKLNNLDENTQRVIVTVAGIVASIGPLLLIFGKLATSISSIITLFSGAGGLAGVLTALTGPLGIILAAVTALAAAWVTNFGGIRDKTKEILESIKTIITSVMNILRGLWEGNLFQIRTLVTAVFSAIEGIVSSALAVIVDIFNIFADIFSGNWEKLGQDLLQLLTDFQEFVWQQIRGIFDVIISIITGYISQFVNAGMSIMNSVKEGVQRAWGSLKQWFNNFLNDPLGTIKASVSSFIQAGKDIMNGLWEGVKSVWSSITDWVTEKVNWIIEKFSDILSLFGGLGGSSVGGSSPRGSYATGLDYVPRDMNVRVHEGEAIVTAEENQKRTSGGDTYNFYSPEALTPVKAAREFKRVKQELALGYR